MKWAKADYKGNVQVWYSGDLINEIKRLCELHISGKKIVMAQEIIDLIEKEDE